MRPAKRPIRYLQDLACTECGGPFRIGELWHRCLTPACNDPVARAGPMHQRCEVRHRLARHTSHLQNPRRGPFQGQGCARDREVA